MQVNKRNVEGESNRDKDLLTLGTNYSVRGSYDPTSDIDDDKFNPGNEWQKYLRWQHAEEKWQLVGILIPKL